ncbi:HAUS augmin-like complex subunit 3 [Pelobates fuscus]|uniref:HAUS augmin-like complex subunit 3 n=1 Tax=Pelobates fuscus TaxID=191477 RepID=UPI002FE4F554
MLSRQRSTCFLLDPPRVQGSDFVEMLRLIDYPGASGLKGEDFDWLSEGNEEAEMFLGWLCGIVDQRNVLNDEQLEAHNALLASGKPLLETEELQKLCRTDGGDGEDVDMGFEPEEHKTLNELEAEVKTLKTLRSHRLRTRNKMESLSLTLRCNHLSLAKFEREEEKKLNRMKETLATLNTKSNTTLTNLSEAMKEFEELHTSVPNVFLSSLDIEGYIELEENCWDEIQFLSMGQLNKEKEESDRVKAQKELETETERVRTAWASQKVQLSIAQGTLYSKEEALRWVQRTREEQTWDHQQIPLLEREIQTIEAEVEFFQTNRIPALVCESSIGPCLSAQMEWLMVEKQRLTRLEDGHVPLTSAMHHQLSRLQLIERGFYEEMKVHSFIFQEIKVVQEKNATRLSNLEKQLQGPRDLWMSLQLLSPIRIASKDHTAVRVSSMLSEPTNKKELFPKYDVLGMKGTSLVHELMSLRKGLKATMPQISSLETECEKLQQSLLRGTRNLQLRDPELTQSFEQLYGAVSQFNQWCLDCLRDKERKKHIIQTSRLEQERRLYVLFYQDPALLASTVEELEQRVHELTMG